ncbi:MAG: DUF4912 domain-containing protein, partial [Halanaerobiaceae bacterium]
MDILVNILVILLAVIAFLFLYYLTLKKDKESQDYTLPFTRPAKDFEFGEDTGVDRQEMEMKKENQISSFKKENYDIKEKNNSIENKETYLDEYYGNNYIRLFSRDPEYLYAYWEIEDNEFFQNTPYLKVSNLNEKKDFEIEINHHIKNWYIKGKANNSFRVSIGYKKDSIFYSLASSKVVYTPADRPSSVIDEHWMTIEELSRYSYRVEMDTMSMIKEIEQRKIQEELEADSFV